MSNGKRGAEVNIVAIKQYTEIQACMPVPIFRKGFNQKAILPYGLTTSHIQQSMKEFLVFLGFINRQLRTKRIPRLELFMMAASFSCLVGEFMGATIPRFCNTLVKNRYHNG